MKSPARLAAYVGMAMALLFVFILAPGAWAEPLQNRHGQTVPTRTPVGGVAPTSQPTDSASRPAQPPAGSTPAPSAPSAPAAPSGGTAPTARPSLAASPLSLTKTADRSETWPGAVVQFTLTLANQGKASVRQVVITDVLPAGLEPGQVQGAAQGTQASWQGRTLTVRRAILPPGGRMAVTFAARVAGDVRPDLVIVNTASASATGAPAVTASATLFMPPQELPPTGGEGRAGR
jgi:uncharacterized repeat protein (TIGR01451 family)